jgi:hypothetical protein
MNSRQSPAAQGTSLRVPGQSFRRETPVIFICKRLKTIAHCFFYQRSLQVNWLLAANR